jgi:hypothetical protein
MSFGFFRQNGETAHDWARERMSAFLDGRLPRTETSGLEAHLSSCAVCRDELQALRATRQLVRAMPMARLPRTFTLQAAPGRTVLPRSFFYLRTATAMAAASFVALLAASVLLPTVGPSSASAPAVQQAKQAPTAAPASSQPSLRTAPAVPQTESATAAGGAGSAAPGAAVAATPQAPSAPAPRAPASVPSPAGTPAPAIGAAQPGAPPQLAAPAAGPAASSQATSQTAPAAAAAQAASATAGQPLTPTAAAAAQVPTAGAASDSVAASPTNQQKGSATRASPQANETAVPSPAPIGVPTPVGSPRQPTAVRGGEPASVLLVLQIVAGALTVVFAFCGGAVWWMHRRRQ